MSASSKSPLAQALAALEGAMANPSRMPASPERRRAAHRIGELIRSEDDDLEAFARRHLPGREVDLDVLRRTREALLHFERVLALVGRSVEAGALLDEVGATVEARLPELEANAAPLPAPGLPAAPDEPSKATTASRPETPEVTDGLPAPPPPAPSAAIVAAAPPATLTLAEPDAPLPIFSVAPVIAEGWSPSSFVPLEPHTEDSDDDEPVLLSRTFEDAAPGGRLPAEPLPFAATRSSATRDMPAFGVEVPRAHVLPFIDAVGGSRNGGTPEVESTVLPFRKSGMNLLAPLPQHLLAMPLEDYVTYRVLLEVHPSRRTELDAHYGIEDAAASDALSLHWQRRLAADPAVRVRWDELYPRTLAYYRGAP
jgi:hypothetical protein